MTFPGALSEIEEREAASFNGYRWKEWLELDRDEQAAGIAHFRIRRLIEMHVGDAQSQAMDDERRAQKARNNGAGAGDD